MSKVSTIADVFAGTDTTSHTVNVPVEFTYQTRSPLSLPLLTDESNKDYFVKCKGPLPLFSLAKKKVVLNDVIVDSAMIIENKFTLLKVGLIWQIVDQTVSSMQYLSS